MDCPKCQSEDYCKDGMARGRQRYLCKTCRYRYTVAQRSGTATEATKRQALHLYLEGLGFRSIGRILHYSNVSILNWIRAFGEQLPDIKGEALIQTLELDELHTYVGQKKTIAGYGLLLIEMQKDSSIVSWVAGELQQEKLSGMP